MNRLRVSVIVVNLVQKWPKIQQKHHTTNGSFQIRRPWQRLHIDYAGAFLDYMWFIIVDAHSKWPVVVPTKDTSAENTTEMLLDAFATHGFCKQIVSDNGASLPQKSSRSSAKLEAFSTASLLHITHNQMVKQRDLFKCLKQQ